MTELFFTHKDGYFRMLTNNRQAIQQEVEFPHLLLETCKGRNYNRKRGVP